MSIKKYFTVGAIALSLLASPISFANNPMCKKHCKAHHKHAFLQKLTEQQRNQIKTAMQSFRKQAKPLHQQLRSLRKQVRQQYQTNNPQWQSIKQLTDQMNQLKNQLTLKRAQFRFDIYQKTGVMLPSKRHHHHHPKQRKKALSKKDSAN